MTDEAPKPATEAVRQARLIRTASFRTAYSNTFRIRLGTNDVGLTFGYQTEMPNNQAVVIDEAEIVFTPPLFKVLSHAIAEAVKGMESAFGEIELPEEMQQALKDGAEQTAQAVARFKTTGEKPPEE
jgi:Protein of unknown function (DUF3467)